MGSLFDLTAGWRVPLKIPKDCWRKFKPNNKSADSSSTNKHKAEDEMFTNPTKRFRLEVPVCRLIAEQRPKCYMYNVYVAYVYMYMFKYMYISIYTYLPDVLSPYLQSAGIRPAHTGLGMEKR